MWSLLDQEVAEGRGAGGRRDRFVGWALREALRPHADRVLVIALHLHLAVAGLPLRSRGARLAVFLHGIEGWRPLSYVRRKMVEMARPLIANSAFTAARFATRSGAVRAPSAVVCHLGLPPASTPGPGSETDMVLSVGRLVATERYKGTDALLEAWPALLRTCPGARLVVVGDGDDRVRLERRAFDLGLGAHARFLGRVEPDELQALYASCTIFALPSTEEGFGLVYLEAMRAARCVLAGPGAPEEVVETGRSGVVVDPADRAELARTIAELLRDPSRRARLAEAGHRRWRERFTDQAFTGRLRAALDLPDQASP